MEASFGPSKDSRPVVRAAIAADAPELALVHVESWRETYRGIARDEILDDPTFIGRREQFWTAALTDERYRRNKVAAATLGGHIVGVAMAGPPSDAEATWSKQLYVLYTYASVHGQGAGAALLDAVIDPYDSAVLWVADPNPRAQAFYRKHGFELDGADKLDDGIREVRMIRLLRE